MDIMHDRMFKIRRNLADAGCGDLMIKEFLELDSRRKREEQYRLLKKQKSILLKKLHSNQSKIDCLDHMIYTMREEDKKESGETK